MLEFFKHLSISTWIMIILIGGGAIVGTIYALIRHFTGWKDRGFMKDEQGNKLLWAVDQLPLMIHYPDSMPNEALAAMRDSIRRINGLVQCMLYDLGTPIESFNWLKMRETWAEKHCTVGTILVEVVNSDDEHGGTTDLRWGNDGTLICGFIRVNMTHCNNGTVWQHELGHGVGLDHDNDMGSMMYSRVTGRSQDFVQGDIRRLELHYGRKGTA
jgi:hypothetical protein